MIDTPPQTERVPLARLTPAPWNPRTLRDHRFRQLCASLQADPEFLWDRPILATTDGVIFAGNQKWRAAEHLGWETIPARLVDIPEWLAKERALKDNLHVGEDDEQGVAELLAELSLQERDLTTLGYEGYRLNELLDSVGLLGEAVDPASEWQGMPAFEHEDKTAYRSLNVHFPDAESVEAFAALVGQPLTPKTRAIWFPPQDRILYGEARES